MRASLFRPAGIGDPMLARLSRRVRKVLRLLSVALRQPVELIRLPLSLPARPRVLIIEPNNCHAEVVIGMGKYFTQLGYNCQYLVSSDIEKEKPFCRMPEGRARAHYLMYPVLMRVVTSRFLALYDIALLASSFDYRKMAPFLEKYRFERKPRNGLLFIEHDLGNLTLANRTLHEAYEANRLLVLTNYRADVHLTEILPCYFGAIQSRETRGLPVIMLVPGTNAQNLESLIRAAKTLLERGVTHFELHIVGALGGESAGKLVEALGIGAHVKLLGRVDFPALYREIELSDFLVGPQDVSSYLNRKTSGSRQLSFGFTKPLILPDQLAAAWGFGSSTSVNYAAREGLAGAMERALLLHDDEYGRLVNGLRVARASGEQDSSRRLGQLLARFTPAADAV